MRTYLECMPCFIRQALEAMRENISDEAKTLEALKKVLLSAAKFDTRKSPPEMGRIIHRIVRRESGCDDPYPNIKKHSIAEALKVADRVRDAVKKSKDPFREAIKYSIAGNILDYAIISKRDEYRLWDSLRAVESATLLHDSAVEKLRERLNKAESVLFIADNAGETVFDRILIENLPGTYKIFYAVKGAPVINDATASDAEASGIGGEIMVVANGSDAPGTILKLCSREFKKLFRECDVIIAKGQANFETLNEAGRETFFLLQIKCPVIGKNYGYRVGDWIVTTAQSGKKEKKNSGIK